jgi:hypothetical protein
VWTTLLVPASAGFQIFSCFLAPEMRAGGCQFSSGVPGCFRGGSEQKWERETFGHGHWYLKCSRSFVDNPTGKGNTPIQLSFFNFKA